MMLLTRVRRNGRVDLLIVLAEENIERIKKYDAAEVLWPQLPPEYSARRPHTIGVAFATASDLAEIERMSVSDPDWQAKAMEKLSRGFEFRPDLGDHDFGPIVLGEPTKETKQ